MSLTKVQAKTKDHPEPIEVEYDFGDGSLKGLVEKFGEEVVLSRAMSALVIDLQALMRRHRESKDFSMDKLKEAVKNWKPTVVTAVRRSATERLEETITKLTPEQRAELLKKLMGDNAGEQPKVQSQAPKQTATAKK